MSILRKRISHRTGEKGGSPKPDSVNQIKTSMTADGGTATKNGDIIAKDLARLSRKKKLEGTPSYISPVAGERREGA
jgi:hypothetical protein